MSHFDRELKYLGQFVFLVFIGTSNINTQSLPSAFKYTLRVLSNLGFKSEGKYKRIKVEAEFTARSRDIGSADEVDVGLRYKKVSYRIRKSVTMANILHQ